MIFVNANWGDDIQYSRMCYTNPAVILYNLRMVTLSVSLYTASLSASFSQSLAEEMQASLDGQKDLSNEEEPVTKKVRVATPEPTPGKIIQYLHLS